MSIDHEFGSDPPFADTPAAWRARKRRAQVEEIDVPDDLGTDLVTPVFVDGVPTYREPDTDAPAADELLGVSEASRPQLAALIEEERLLSVERRALHARIDFVHGQGASDEITIDQLDYLIAKERLLSVRRRTLHHQINRLREALPPS